MTRIIDNKKNTNFRSIETAPRDRDFLVKLPDGKVTVGRYMNGKNFCVDASYGSYDEQASTWCEIPQ